MTFDYGVLTLCELINTAQKGDMPKEQLSPVSTCFCGERTIGVTRLYAAQGVNEQIDLLLRVWADVAVHVDMYAVTENGDQYRITAIQSVLDEDGLKCKDLTLRRVDKLYDVVGQD